MLYYTSTFLSVCFLTELLGKFISFRHEFHHWIYKFGVKSRLVEFEVNYWQNVGMAHVRKYLQLLFHSNTVAVEFAM